MKRLFPYVVAGVAVASITLAQTPPSAGPNDPATPSTQPPAASPRRLTIKVSVADPEDLKVKQGDRVSQGQLLADRSRERQRLEAQREQLSLTLQKLQGSTITTPLPPAAVPEIATLPRPSYLEEEAAIERAKASVDQAEANIQAKKQELLYLAELEHLDPLVLEHERAKLSDLQRAHTAVVRDFQLAQGKLEKAKANTDYQEYRHSLDLAERVERANQASLSYQRQWAEYEQRLRNRDYQLSQTQLRLDEIENAIASLSVVRAPYAGRIRQIKWLGQGPDGSLSAEITLLVRDGDSSGASMPGQLDGVPSGADGVSDSEFLGD